MATAPVTANAQAKRAETHRVVFQMSTADAQEQKGLIRNLTHLVEGWGR